MDTWTLKDTIQIVVGIFQAFGSFGIVVTLWIYYRNRTQAFESAMQANRARVTEAYMAWNRAMLLNNHNTRVSGELLRRFHHVFEKEELSDDESRAVHMLYLLVNALFLEWTYRETYKLDKAKFFDTVENTLGGFFTNRRSKYAMLPGKFREMFVGFDDRFLDDIEKHFYGRMHTDNPGSVSPNKSTQPSSSSPSA